MSVDILGTVNRRKNGAAPGHDPGERGECHAKSRGQKPKRKPKKRTPTFRLEFFIWRTDTQRASGITAANQPRMSIIAHVFGNVKPRRRKAPPGGQARRSRRREGLRSGLQWEGCGRRLEGTPGGPAKRGGEARLEQPRASPEPQRGGGDGRGAGRTPQRPPAPRLPAQGVGAPASGRTHARRKPRGRKPKKRRLEQPPMPPGLEPPGPEAPKGASQGGPASREKGDAHGWREQGQPERQRRTPADERKPGATTCAAAGDHGARSAHTGASFEAGGWRRGPAPALRGLRRAPRPEADPPRGRGPGASGDA